MGLRRTAGVLAALLALGSAASVMAANEANSGQPSKSKWRIALKPVVSAFYPTSATARDRFGGAWLSMGVSFGLRGSERQGNRLEACADSLYHRSGGSRVIALPLGVSFKHRFSRSMGFSPYAGVGGFVCPVDLQSPSDNIDTGLRAMGAGSVFFGANIGPKINVEASYYSFEAIKGFDLSGLRVYASMLL